MWFYTIHKLIMRDEKCRQYPYKPFQITIKGAYLFERLAPRFLYIKTQLFQHLRVDFFRLSL